MSWAILAFAAVALAACLTPSLIAIAATRREGKQDARASELAVRLEIAIANSKTEAARADNEKARADALDDLIDQMAAMDDPAAARAHVLSRRARKAGPADGRDPGTVQGSGPNPEVAGGADDALLKPGE